jgi:L-alanine-DL-glutamate epimerase-like enolase superfamily enzyme
MCPSAEAAVTRVTARAYTIPTDAPESDGTIAWDSTTMVAAEVEAGGEIGLGYTYCDKASASVIEGVLAKALKDKDALATEACWSAMNAAVRNAGRPGIASCAVSAVDIALWDLKAKLFRVPLATLLAPRAGPYLSTAVAASPPTATRASRSSSAAGLPTAAPS